MLTINNAKSASNFICDKCEFKCCKKSNYEKHLNTLKHKSLTNLTEKKQKMPHYSCSGCDKDYKSREGLWYHKKKCNNNTIISENDENKIINSPDDVKMLTSLIMEVVKSNSDLQKQTLEMQQQMLEVCKNNNNTTNNMNNCHNKTFNMQVFLNEKCKDAMNLTDFVNSMMLQFSDLEELGELGYVEGISRQMVRKLNEMDVYKRPIHCSDLKRETMYVRDNDVWEKETEIYDKLRKAIKYITKKNGDLMIPWRDAHPQCMKLEHPLNDVYLRIMNQAMGGKGEFAESESKIIRKISKSVTINKNDF
jgi:hypothetical protein